MPWRIPRRTVRGLVVFVAAGAMLAVLVASAQAGAPVRFLEHRIGFVCEEPPLSNASGTVVLNAVISDTEGPSGVVIYWAAPADPLVDPPTMVSSSTEPTQVTGTADHLEAVYPMESIEGDPVGTATLVADLAPTGEVVEDEPTHVGNRLVRDRSVNTELVVTAGTLTLPDGVTFDLTGCPGFDLVFDLFLSQPDAFVIQHKGVLLVCSIATEEYTLDLAASADETGTGGSLVFTSPDASFESSRTSLTLTPEDFSGVFELQDSATGEAAGQAVVDVTFSRGERVVLAARTPGSHTQLTGWQLEPTGTVTIPTDPQTVVDLSSCFALDGRQHDLQTFPGPPPEE